MPIRNYGVLKARVLRAQPERRRSTPHFHVLVAAGDLFHVAVGTRSADGAPDLLYHASDDFQHSHLEFLAALPDGAVR